MPQRQSTYITLKVPQWLAQREDPLPLRRQCDLLKIICKNYIYSTEPHDPIFILLGTIQAYNGQTDRRICRSQ